MKKNVWKGRLSVLLMTAMMLNTTAAFAAQNSWQEEDGKWYYYNNDGKKVCGEVKKVQGKWYAFDDDGVMRNDELVEVNGINLYALPQSNGKSSGQLASRQWVFLDSDWHQCNHRKDPCACNWYYFQEISENSEGDIAKGGAAKDGVKKILENWYYFDETGAMAINEFVDVEGRTMYAGSDGALASKKWMLLEAPDGNGKSWYHFKELREEDGKLKGGIHKDETVKIGDSWFAFDKEGKMITKDWYTSEEGEVNYYQFEGFRAVDKWLPLNGLWYRFNENGKVTEYAQMELDGTEEPMEELGTLASASNAPCRQISSIEPVKDSVEVTAGEEVKLEFKVNLATSSNARSTKLTKDHDFWAERSNGGSQHVDVTDENKNICTVSYSSNELGGEEVYLYADGVKSASSVKVTTILPKGTTEDEHKVSSVLNSVLQEDFENPNEAVNTLKNLYAGDETKDSMKELWLNAAGKDLEALNKLEDEYVAKNRITREEPSIAPEAKELLGHDSIEIRGDGLNAGPGGSVQLSVNAPKDDDWKLDGDYENQVAVDFEFLINNEKVSSLNIPVVISMNIPKGLTGKNLELFNLHEGNKIKLLVKINGNKVSFVTDQFSTYVFANAKEAEEKPTPGGNTSSGGGSGGRSASAARESTMSGKWIADANGWKFLKDNGEYAVNSWGYIKGQWYFFDAQGNMVTGWYLINSQWYYLNPAEGSSQGAMMTGWNLDPTYNAWFYLSENGAMVSGWKEINGKWYYFNPVSDGTKGSMAVNTTIDGYYVGADGVWVQ